MKKIINWKIFFVLLSLSLMSVVCVFPYVVTVQAELLNAIDVPITTIFLAQFIQSIILFSVVIFFGLIFTKKINFQLPLLELMVKKGDYMIVLKNIAGKSIFFGIAVAVSIYGLDILFTILGAGLTTHQNYAPIWQTLLASFYGGITEEVLMRLFMMTLFIFLGMKLLRQKKPSVMIILISIVLAAIIFGLGHLPITSSLTKITPLVVSRAVVLNGVGGVVFGWLFWKKGLESAMIAHFTADIFLLTILPSLLR
ncbi:MAG: CPBP family glutamic-type intramembrane protease [Candidatus Roizmanbacteria bacterium]|nr:CPBP family glutamic-type intramembrane protease [Candidatus Roizmanbacteria bacterium]